MKSRTAALVTAVLGLGLVLLAPRLALSPGPVTSGHAKIEDRCLDCHDLGRGASSGKCVACHALDRIGAHDAATAGIDRSAVSRRTAITGMHRSFERVACDECHTDHAGRAPAAATRAFAHEAISADLHSQCATCHEASRPADDLHRAARDECGICHATHAWTPATFAHEKYFVLDRDHSVACRSCHDQPADYRAYTCYGCHEHTRERMLSEHREEGVQELDACVLCHRSADNHEGRGERGPADGGGERRHGRDGDHERDDDNERDDD